MTGGLPSLPPPGPPDVLRPTRDEKPLSVAVLLDLERGPLAGGHVKCWERFAEAAAGLPGLDLTLYVLGRRERVEPVASNVRFATVRALLPTSPLQGVVGGVDATDLAPFSPALARRLPAHDVWHATHCFALSRTAARLARRSGHPLVGSVHTDVPMLTGVYARQVAERAGVGLLRPLLARVRVAERAVAAARRRQDEVLVSCARVLVSSEADGRDVERLLPPRAVSRLRRGVDTARFGPDPGARAWLEAEHGVPPGHRLVLFAGRVDATKGVMVVAEAVRSLVEAGRPVHLVVAGGGADAGRVRAGLGRHASLLGPLPQEQLARVYPACDALAFPSLTETIGNVVAEAMACGLPVVLPRGARTNGWLAEPGVDGLVVDGQDPAGWARSLDVLLQDDGLRAAVSAAALRTARAQHPSWRDVLLGDLLPVWAEAASGGRRGARVSPR